MSRPNIGKLLELFDLDRDFTDEELRVAYKDLVQVWHPDKYAHNERLKTRAENKIKELNEAYTTLRKVLNNNPGLNPRPAGAPQGSPGSGFINSIFHPTDFKEASDIAFAHALKLSVAARARLDLFHVSPERNKELISEFPKIRDTLVKWNVLPENSSQEDFRNLGFYYQKIIGFHKDTVSSILQYLDQHPSDMTVLATRQKTGAGSLLFKSVAEKVSRKSGGMTLFLQDKKDGFVTLDEGKVTLKNILIPVDDKPDPMLSVNAAFRIAQLLECGECYFTLLYVGDASGMPDFNPPAHGSWEWKKLTLGGNVVETILGVAGDISADLVVMGTQGHQGFLDALRGNTTEQVLRRGASPLLAVPERRTLKRNAWR
ncbi:MAG: universal stress protein [Deltaproteobacteria bacterium]